jgi:signal transduction histidine kinase/ActR/RegA family two-component response regulator
MTPADSAPPAFDEADALERRVLAARVRLLFDQNLPAVLAIMPFVCLVWWFLWPVAGHAHLNGWVASKAFATVVLIALDRLYRRQASEASAAAWGRSYTLALAFDGLSWSAIAIDMVPADRIDLQAVMVAMIVGVAALAVLAQSVYMQASIVFSASLIAPVSLWHLMQSTRIGTFAGVGLGVFLAFIVISVRRTSHTTSEMLRLRYRLDEVAEQRARALAEAQRHSAVKSQFLATMSHEMRTPLHGILGSTRLIRDEPLTATARERLELVDRSGRHLLDLISDILDFSRSEAGELRLHAAPFDFDALLRDVAGMASASARDKGLSLECASTLGAPVWQSGDAKRLRQVLINLVGNAVKFTDQGAVTVSARRQGAGIVVAVRDTGIGIDPAFLPRVFDPFQQGDSSYARRHDGTGLGLTISRELARAMGGDITCESVPGQGSTFTLALPWRPCEAPAEAPAPAVQAPDAAAMRGRVLLAEDNVINVLVARSMLQSLGLDVTVAGDGADALAAFLEAPPAVVLMDCHMPRMDGFEATRCIRAAEDERGWPRTPIIAVTANALQEDRQNCLDAGMDDYLSKPFTPEDLRAAIERHCPAFADRRAA